MLTLCTMALLEEAANLGHDWTGGFDGLASLPIPPILGLFEFNPLYPKTQYLYALGVLFVCFVFVRTLVYSPFGQSLTGIRENIAAHARGRRAGARAAGHLLHDLGGASPASPAACGRRPTPTSTSARSASTARRRC